MSRATSNRAAISDRYLELVREFPLRPIRTKPDYDRAGRRSLSKANMLKLAEHFKLNVSVFFPCA